ASTRLIGFKSMAMRRIIMDVSRSVLWSRGAWHREHTHSAAGETRPDSGYCPLSECNELAGLLSADRKASGPPPRGIPQVRRFHRSSDERQEHEMELHRSHHVMGSATCRPGAQARCPGGARADSERYARRPSYTRRTTLQLAHLLDHAGRGRHHLR